MIHVKGLIIKDISPDDKERALSRIDNYIKRYPNGDLEAYVKRINNELLLTKTKRDLYNNLNRKLINGTRQYLPQLKIHLDTGKYAREYIKGNTKPFDLLADHFTGNKKNALKLVKGDFRKTQIEDNSIDLIITDPPYPKEFLTLYKDLAIFAERVLKPGGSLFTMAGQSYLPEVFSLLNVEGLDYNWTLSYLTPGGQSPQLWQRKVNAFWKPVLWYTKGKNNKWLGDVVKSNTNDNDKRFHHWGQSISGMIDLIERTSYVGEIILDPFLGGGSTGIAALAMDRKFIGIEIEENIFKKAQKRIINQDELDEIRCAYLSSRE